MSTITETIRRFVGGGQQAAGGPFEATWSGTVIASSDRTVVVEGNHYFPRDALDTEYFQSSDHQTVCPWKGSAAYYDVVVDGERNHNAAWYYPSPRSAAAKIKDHVAFWHGVKVRQAAQ